MFPWLKNLLEIVAILISVADELFDSAGSALVDFFDAFPNPVSMANVVIGFFTSIAGIIVSKVGTFYFDLAASQYEKVRGHQGDSSREEIGRPYQSVMTPAQALRWVGECAGDTLKTLSGTNSSSIAELILGAVGRWLYRLLKGGIFRFLLKIIGVTSEAAMILLFKKKIIDAAGGLLVKAIMAAFVALCVLNVAITSMMIFVGATIIAPKRWQQFALFGQHKRRKERVRLYRRVGGVAP